MPDQSSARKLAIALEKGIPFTITSKTGKVSYEFCLQEKTAYERMKALKKASSDSGTISSSASISSGTPSPVIEGHFNLGLTTGSPRPRSGLL